MTVRTHDGVKAVIASLGKAAGEDVKIEQTDLFQQIEAMSHVFLPIGLREFLGDCIRGAEAKGLRLLERPTLGGTDLVELIRTETHTCYLGERGTLHAWGYGCGECPACELRARGYEKFMAESNS
jgi:hypothetical protein